MRTIRIFQPGPFELGKTVMLSPEAGLHVGVVLRMQASAPITLFCGDNCEYHAVITEVHKKKVTVQVVSVEVVNRESPRAIHLAQAISKGDRMEWVIQKAIELGVKSVTPLLTAHCVVRLDEARLQKKQQQWQAIAIAACEQSGRNIIPQIHPAMQMGEFLQHCSSPFKLILDPRAQATFRDMNFHAGDIALLIGPEGGLSEEEIAHAQSYEFMPLALGPRVMRTETAAIAALSVLQAMAGDL